VSGNGRFGCTRTTAGLTKIIAGAIGCMDLSQTRVPPTLAAATFRIRLLMERGFMRRRISPGSATPAHGAGMNGAMTPDMALEDMWI
jgi:hypothetical protein